MDQPQSSSLFNKKLYPQWIAAAGVILFLLQLGAMCGWSSPYLARLTLPDSSILLTLDQASWVASLLNVGRFFGAILGSILADYRGSKNTIIFTLLPIAVNWILLLIADRPLILYAARVFGGFGVGMLFSCFSLYIGEIALPEIRGAMVTLGFCGSMFGNFMSGVIGYYLSVSMSSIVFLVPCLIDIVLFFKLPDSPYHLVKIGDFEGAKRSINWYRSGEKVEEELEAIKKFVTVSSSKSFGEKFNEFKNSSVRRAAFIVTMLFIFMQICGLNDVLFYMEMIFRRAKFDLIHPSVAVMCVIFSGVLTTLLSVNMMDKCGRRVLLIVSGCGITVSMISLGTHFLLLDLNYNPEDFQWLPLISLLLFMTSFVFGLINVPATVLSEMFPVNVKFIVACITSLVSAIFAFAATKSYQPLVDLLGETYVFYIHAIFSAILVPFVLYFLPETKGKSLQQIQDELING